MSDSLLDRVAEFVIRTSMANGAKRIAAAVSGGADSVVLLHLLHQLRARLHFDLLVVHVNHHLRGSDSDADEDFVRDLAARLELPIIVESAAPPHDGNIEQAARNQRRAFFASLLAQGLADRIALGHTLSDQAETVLFRMIRGTGLTGLAGMPPVTGDSLIRPLLELTREEVRQYASQEALRWREDATNQDRAFRRNLIRLDLLPLLRGSFHEKVEQNLANIASLAQVEEDYWREETAKLLNSLAVPLHATSEGQGWLLDSTRLMALHPAAQRRVIRSAILQVKGDLKQIASEHVLAILHLCRSTEGHDRVLIPGIDALRSFDRLRLAPPAAATPLRHYRVDISWSQHVSLPFQAGAIQMSPSGHPPDLRPPLEIAEFDADLFEAQSAGRLYIRNWEPGDEYRRLGHRNSEKVKTLFQEQRVYLWERRHWPVLEAAGSILWVKNFGPAAEFAATAHSRAIIRLSYYKEPLPGQ